MVAFISILAYIFIGSLGISVLYQARIEKAVATVIFGTILVLYVFAIFNQLLLGFYFCVGIIFLTLLFLIAHFLKRKLVLKDTVITMGALVFFVFFVLNWKMNSGRLLSDWDEFSHWGLVAKNVYFLNHLGSFNDATTSFKGYPPATVLFQYFWSKLYGSYAEGNLFRSINVLNFSMIVSFFSFQKKSVNFFRGLIQSLVLVLIPLIFFGSYYASIYVDATLGVIFSYILLTYFLSQRNEHFSGLDKLNIILASGVLVLVKASGMGLALIAFFIILIDQIVANKSAGKLRFMLGYLTSFLCANYSWSLFLKLNQVPVAWNTGGVSAPKIIKLLIGDGHDYQFVVARNFVDRIFSGEYAVGIFNMTPFLWIVLACLISAFLISAEHRKKHHLAVLVIGLQLGNLVYAISLLVLYLFTYSEYEAIHLASFTRYLGTYFVAMYLVLGVLLLVINQPSSDNHTEVKSGNLMLVKTLLFLLLFSNGSAIENTFVLNTDVIKQTVVKRQEYRFVTAAAKVVPQKSHVYFISQNTDGFDYWTARYIFTPQHINQPFTWSIGKRYDAKDIWTKRKSVNEWRADLLKHYQFLFIKNVDDQFIKRYKGLFVSGVVSSNSLYKVTKVAKGKPILEKVKLPD